MWLVFECCSTGKKYSIELDTDMTVAQVRACISNEFNIDVVRINFGSNTRISDDTMLKNIANIEEFSLIQIETPLQQFLEEIYILLNY